MKKIILIIIVLSMACSTSAAWELLVPSQYRSIQSAINTAGNGDIIIVEAGTYNENINFNGKAIIVRNSNPGNWLTVKNTIIDGGWNNSCVAFNTGEGNNSVLEGFTLINGGGTNVDYSYYNGRITDYAGGGIFCLNSSPTIRHCNITDNGIQRQSRPGGRTGGGGYTESTIRSGGGIALIGNCQANIECCFIYNNQADYGPGIIIRSFMPEQANSTIRNCTITNNWSNLYDNIYEIDCWDTRPAINNTIIWGSLFIADPSLVTYSCVREAYVFEGQYNEYADPCDLTGIEGNISQNPLFVLSDADSIAEDYHILPDSPCINAGDPEFTNGSEIDIDGQSRIMGGRIDIGADETIPEITVTKPSGSEVWTLGSIHEIVWSTYNAGTVNVLFGVIYNGDRSPTRIGNKQLIGTDIPDTGSYTWQIPDNLPPDQYVIFVEPTISDANVVCNPSGQFTIQPYYAGVEVESKWKSLGGDFTRSGLNENNGPEVGCVKWKFETDGAVSTSVTIGYDDRVHIACEDGKLYTLNSEGELIWNFNANSPLLSAPTIGPDGTVYVGSQNGKLFAIDVDGNLRWTHDTKGLIFSSPAVSENGNVYVGSQDGTLYALGPDGSELWSFETKGPGKVLEGSILASPTIGIDGTVYIGGLYDPNLYALDPINGSVRWACNFESQGWPFASPVVAADGTIYQTLLYDPNLYAINYNDGTIIWSTNLQIRCDFVDDFIATYGYSPLIELIRENCEYWIQYPTEFDTYSAYQHYTNSWGWSEPSLGPDGTIYVSFDDPYLRAVDPNGSIKWVTDLGVVGGFTLTVGKNSLIYAASDDGYLYVVDADGWEVARFSSSNWLNYPVIAGDNILIVSEGRDDSLILTDYKNKVWAISLESCDGQTYDLHWIEDLDADGNVNFADLTLLADDWLDCTDIFWPCNYEGDEIYLKGDIDRDKYTFFSDLEMIADRWLGSARTPKGPRPPKLQKQPAGWPTPPEPSPPPKRACFFANTPVWLDGELVQISDAVSGQTVGKTEWSLANQPLEQIEKVEKHEGIFECYDVFLKTGDCISVADSHYFLTDTERWIRVQDLKNGSRLNSINGPVTVTRIIKKQKPFVDKCYNLKIKDADRYFVGQDGIIVRDW